MTGAIIIEPRDKDSVEFDREYSVLLSDWTDADPESIFRNLVMESDYYSYHRSTVPDFISEAREKGLGKTFSTRLTWARMNMSPNDLSDVSGATYTYLLNGKRSEYELDRALPAGRAGAPSFHQCFGDDIFRCTYPRVADDGSTG